MGENTIAARVYSPKADLSSSVTRTKVAFSSKMQNGRMHVVAVVNIRVIRYYWYDYEQYVRAASHYQYVDYVRNIIQIIYCVEIFKVS